MPRTVRAIVVPVVSELRADNDAVALAAKGFCQYRFSRSVTIRVTVSKNVIPTSAARRSMSIASFSVNSPTSRRVIVQTPKPISETFTPVSADLAIFHERCSANTPTVSNPALRSATRWLYSASVSAGSAPSNAISRSNVTHDVQPRYEDWNGSSMALGRR